jgi:protocatechuate 3,4-dioxygenase beta subunit
MSIVKPNIFDGEKHRPMTNAEFDQWQADQEAIAILEAEAEAKAQAKATAEAKLVALGLDLEDLRALGL